MPPKKGKKGKAKGKKKKKEGAELELEDRYRRTVDEIEALKDHLAMRKEFSRRAQSAGVEWKQRMKSAEDELTTQKDDQRMISADMTRQYKTMQTEMGLRVHQLEAELTRTRQELVETKDELQETRDDRERITQEKDDTINKLNQKILSMERSYEGVLNDALNSLIEKIDAAKIRWEDNVTLIQARNKQTLLEFGLNPLDI